MKLCFKRLAHAILISMGMFSFAISEESFDKVKFFESQIRPIFQNNCVECHGAEKQKGGLSLHLKKTAFLGGDTGSPIVIGDAQNSLMIKAVERRNKDFSMPPKKVLPADKVALLRRWIDAGAYWPEDQGLAQKVPPSKNIAESRNTHWAFRPIVRSEKGAKSIDQIIEKQMKAKSLSFSKKANARTLVRRVYYDLIGLPPTFEQVQEFQNNQDPKAFELLVNRLLDMPE